MRMIRFYLLVAASAILAAGCLTPRTPRAVRATAQIEGRAGSTLSGTAMFTQSAGLVRVVVDVEGAPEGIHGVHLHEKGDCSATDFTSAGGHFNPTGAPHGSPEAAQHHAGDFGNMTVGADGHGHLELDTRMLTVTPGDDSVLGRSIVIHEKADDLTSQPSGNAGSRIGCGVVH